MITYVALERPVRWFSPDSPEFVEFPSLDPSSGGTT